jgi:pimeloyl-ACP methyl ester carboxylesterase
MPLPQYQDRTAVVDGSTIRYWVEGSGQDILLVHGLACSVEFWRHNLGPLATGHQVFALDLPGCGLSDKQVAQFSLAYGASFLKGFMDSVGIGRAVVVGHSMGGALCAQFAVQHPERTRALILVDSAGFGRELQWFLRLWTLPLVGEVLFRAYQRAFPALKGMVFCDGSSISDEWIQGAAAMLRMPGVRETALEIVRTGADLGGQREELFQDLHARLPSLNIPALIVWGERDHAVPVSHAERAKSLIPGSKVSIMPGRGHIPQVERPNEFDQLVSDFLGAIGCR